MIFPNPNAPTGRLLPLADIARLACHDTGAVTRVLDRLESKGLIQRVRSESDRRVVNLQLTTEGGWQVVTLTLAASPRFADAFLAAFGTAD